MEKETILEAKGLSKRFALPRKKRKNGEKTFLAVSNLSLLLRRGEIFGLLGPNGAGKTTTLRMLSGLISPSEGEITIFGERLTKDSGHLRAKIGFLTSDLRLDPAFTPDYTFSFFGALYGLSKEQIEAKKKELFHLFGIDDFAFRKIGELSTGMKQKAGLPILTKPAQARDLTGPARQLFEAEVRYTDLYGLCFPIPRPCGLEWTSSPVIMK